METMVFVVVDDGNRTTWGVMTESEADKVKGWNELMRLTTAQLEYQLKQMKNGTAEYTADSLGEGDL